MTRVLLPLTAWLLIACGESAPPPAEAPPPAPAKPAEPSAQTPAQVDQVLAPSPLALEKRVRTSGLTHQLGDLVPTRTFQALEGDQDRLAMRTGVALADTLLRGEKDDKAAFVARLRGLHDGMEGLGTGQGLLGMLQDFIEAVENDTAARADFLQELDAVASTMVPEHGWGPGDSTGPLLQAGAWLAGTNLVAQAIVKQDKPEAAEKLLRLGDVADYFTSYLAGEGSRKAGGALAQPLADGLAQLKAISERETLGIADAQEVSKVTGELLELL